MITRSVKYAKLFLIIWLEYKEAIQIYLKLLEGIKSKLRLMKYLNTFHQYT